MRDNSNRVSDIGFWRYSDSVTVYLFLSIALLLVAIFFLMVGLGFTAIVPTVLSVAFFVVWRKQRKRYGKFNPDWI